VGLGIELVYLVCVIGEVAVHGRLNGWFKELARYPGSPSTSGDFNYGAFAKWPGRANCFRCITSFVVAFFGVVGLNMIWSAITDITK